MTGESGNRTRAGTTRTKPMISITLTLTGAVSDLNNEKFPFCRPLRPLHDRYGPANVNNNNNNTGNRPTLNNVRDSGQH